MLYSYTDMIMACAVLPWEQVARHKRLIHKKGIWRGIMFNGLSKLVFGGLTVVSLLIVLPAASAQIANRQAQVRNIRVNAQGGQVTVTVSGTLPNPCYQFLPPSQTVAGSTITISLPIRAATGRMCSQVIVPFEQSFPVDVTNLAAGQYTVIVNGVRDTFTLQAAGPSAPTTTAVPAPQECPEQGAGSIAYRNENAGFCLSYPDQFEEIPNELMNTIIISLKGESEVRPSLMLGVQPAQEKTLDDVAAEQQAAYPDVTIHFTDTTIGGQPAIVSDNIPGRNGSRQAFVIANGYLYTLTAQPFDDSLPIASAITGELWAAITESLVFFPPGLQPPALANAAEQRLDDLGIRFMLPDGWIVESYDEGYGLIGPKDVTMLTIGGSVYPVSFGALEGLPTDNLDTLAQAAVKRFRAEGESSLTTEPAVDPNGQSIGVTIYGFLEACSKTLIPNGERVTVVTVSSLVCDLDNNITDEMVKAIVQSVQVLEK